MCCADRAFALFISLNNAKFSMRYFSNLGDATASPLSNPAKLMVYFPLFLPSLFCEASRTKSSDDISHMTSKI